MASPKPTRRILGLAIAAAVQRRERARRRAGGGGEDEARGESAAGSQLQAAERGGGERVYVCVYVCVCDGAPARVVLTIARKKERKSCEGKRDGLKSPLFPTVRA